MKLAFLLLVALLAGCLDGPDGRPASDLIDDAAGGEALRHIDYGSLRTYRQGADTCTGMEVSPGIGVQQGGVARLVDLEPGDTRVVFRFDWVDAGMFAPDALVVYIVDGGPLSGQVVTSASVNAGQAWEVPAEDLPGRITVVVAGGHCQGEFTPEAAHYDLWPQMRAEIYHHYEDLSAAPGLESVQEGAQANATVTFVRTGATVCTIMGEDDVGPATSTPVEITTKEGDLLLEGTATWAGDAVLRIEFVVDGTLWFSATGPSPLSYGRVLVGNATVADGEVQAPMCGSAASAQPAIYDVQLDLLTRLFSQE